LQSYKDEKRGPTLVAIQSPNDISTMASQIQLLNGFQDFYHFKEISKENYKLYVYSNHYIYFFKFKNIDSLIIMVHVYIILFYLSSFE